MSQIRIKRSPNAAAPASLGPGELAWSEGSKILYIGTIAGGLLAIAGDGAGFLKANQPITVTGDVTGNGTTSLNLTLGNVVTAGNGTKIAYDAKGRVVGSSALVAADIPAVPIGTVTGLQNALNSKAQLDASGKILAENLPDLSITDTFVVASQAEMLALVAQRGDIAIRSDINDDFILRGDDPKVLANWQKFLHPASQNDGIITINGKTGPAATLNAADVPFQATGNIAATNLQSALAELDSEKLALDRNISFTGDITGTGSAGSAGIALTLKSIVTAGTGTKIAFNAKGQVTGSGSLLEADIPALSISKTSGLQTALDAKIGVNDTIDGGLY